MRATSFLRTPLAMLLAAPLLALFKYGAGSAPNIYVLRAIAANWQDPVPALNAWDNADYILRSSTSAVLAGILGFTSISAFFLFHFALALAALALPFTLKLCRQSFAMRYALLLLSLGSGISAVLLTWVGMYDPVTILAESVAILASSRWLRLLGWGLLAFNHSELAAIAFLCQGVIAVAEDGRSVWREQLWNLLSLIVGGVGIEALTDYWGGAPTRTTDDVTHWDKVLAPALHGIVAFWPFLLFSALGVFWLLLGSPLISKRSRLLLGLLAVAVPLAVSSLALDQSRDAVEALWPSLLLLVSRTVIKVGEERMLGALRLVAPLALVCPIGIVWADAGGHILYPGLNSLLGIIQYLQSNH